MEEKLRQLFDYQKYEKNADLQAVIDAVHARYGARRLSDDEAELVTAAGRPEAAMKKWQDPRKKEKRE